MWVCMCVCCLYVFLYVNIYIHICTHTHIYIYSDWFDAQLKPLAQDMAGSAQSVATDGLAWPKSKHDPQLTEMTDTAGFQELSVWVADSCCSSWFNVPRVSLTKDLKLDKPLGRGYFGEVWQGPQIRSCCSWDMLGSSGDLLTKLCSSVTRSDLRRGYRAGRSSTPVWAATRSKYEQVEKSFSLAVWDGIIGTRLHCASKMHKHKQH